MSESGVDHSPETDERDGDRVGFGPHTEGGDVVLRLEVEGRAPDLAGALPARRLAHEAELGELHDEPGDGGAVQPRHRPQLRA